MAKSDALKIWSSSYRLLSSVIASVSPDVADLGLEAKELFVLASIDENPHPASVSSCLSIPKPSVTVYLKRLEAAGFVRRAIDPGDLRRHRLEVTPAGREVLTRGLSLLGKAFGARLARLDAAERVRLAAALEKMTAEDPAPRARRARET